MNDRLHKLEELMESFQSFKKPHVFSGSSLKMPRITPSQWMALRIISQRGTCTVKNISKSLDMTGSAATQLVNGLVRSSYVIRKTNKIDRREVILTLSEKSSKNIKRMKEHMLRRMLDIFKVLNDQEFEQLYRLNKKISDSLVNK